MLTNARRFNFTRAAVALLLSAAIACGAEVDKRVCRVARPTRRPPGAPKASDVVMRTLRLHPRDDADPYDTRQAIRDFHVSRLEWSYVTDKEFIHKVKSSGRVFGGAASAPSYRHRDDDPDWYENVVIVDLDGEPIIAPWKRTWNRTLWGCVNNPELERGYVEYLKGYIDAGAQVMQRDEPGANYNATRWGGCFCPHCMKAFRKFLAENTTPQRRRLLGIAEVESFDYREHLRKQGAPVGDPFGRWDGGELKGLFVEFQTQSTLAFHRRTRKAIDRYAGRHVPFSCNNGARRWTPIELVFDWFFGELSYAHARPDNLHSLMHQAAAFDRVQVVTMPKKGDREDLEAWRRRTRQTIATAYACGGLCMVPWDVYMPKDAPRYFGAAEQYADLFGFIRAGAAYLDGYEEAAAIGRGIDESRYGNAAPVTLSDGTAEVYAFVRAKPDQPDAPVVIHLVSWSDRPEPFTLKLRTECFFGRRPLAAKLLVPPSYDGPRHEKAEQTGDYSALAKTVDLRRTSEPGIAVLQIPALTPWGMVVVSPSK